MRPFTPDALTSRCAKSQRAEYVVNRGGYCANNQLNSPFHNLRTPVASGIIRPCYSFFSFSTYAAFSL